MQWVAEQSHWTEHSLEMPFQVALQGMQTLLLTLQYDVHVSDSSSGRSGRLESGPPILFLSWVTEGDVFAWLSR